MSKILVADDSPTIQKVVAITLAGQGFELSQANNANDLINKLKENSFDLVLLDMGLAEGKNLNQFLQEIKKFSNAPLMGMYGTFDTVNDAEVQKLGLSDYIVKPFESDRFIEKCKSLVESGSTDSSPGISLVDNDSAASNGPESTEEQWVLNEDLSAVNANNSQENVVGFEIEQDDVQEISVPNNLSNNLKDWGFSVPGIIGNEQSVGEKPPVIKDSHEDQQSSDFFETIDLNENESTKQDKTGPISLEMLSKGNIIHGSATANIELEEGETVLPKDDDLAYPDMGLAVKPKSQLVPLSNLTGGDDEIDEDATDPGFSLQDVMKREANLEMALGAENENGDFWAIDDSSTATGNLPRVEVKASSNLDEFKNIANKEREFEFELGPVAKKGKSAPADKQSKNEPVMAVSPSQVKSPQWDQEEIVNQLLSKIMPALESRIDQKIKEIAERVAWEVIPDTAENMLRTELKEVVKAVYQELSDAH